MHPSICLSTAGTGTVNLFSHTRVRSDSVRCEIHLFPLKRDWRPLKDHRRLNEEQSDIRADIRPQNVINLLVLELNDAFSAHIRCR